MLEIPVGKWYCQVQGINPDDINSCITNYYQYGPRTLEKSCLNEVLVVSVLTLDKMAIQIALFSSPEP